MEANTLDLAAIRERQRDAAFVGAGRAWDPAGWYARDVSLLLQEVDRLKQAASAWAFKERAADALADAVAAMVTRGVLNARSLPADALLNYRDPPRTDRSDQLAKLERENERLRKAIEPIKVGGPDGVPSATVEDYYRKCLKAWEETKR